MNLGRMSVASFAQGSDAATRLDAPMFCDSLDVSCDSLVAASAATPSSPRYVVGPRIGCGGMGEVYVARDSQLGREVAIKMLRTDDRDRDDLRARFLREARVQGRLEHPSIVPVHDLGIDDAGNPFFVMKRLSGMTLAEILDRVPYEPQLAATWHRRALLDRLVDVCQAVEYAHQRGVVHRDIKPQNIMLGDLGEVYVLDWGIARILGEDPVDVAPRRVERDVAATTRTGAIVGTLGYMAPEQYENASVDPRADVYALGCVMFEVLTGRLALPFGTAAYVVATSTSAHSPSARHPETDLAPELDALCAAATCMDPDRRLASAGELAAGIQRYLDGDRDGAVRRELADTYATAAHEQFGRATDDDARALAMHSAGRALALDPTHRDAQSIVGRLLLQPPAAVPAAVEGALNDHRDTTGRKHFRTAAFTYASYLAFLPFLAFARVHDVRPIILILATIAVNFTILVTIARKPHPSEVWLYVVLAIHGLLLGICGVLIAAPLILPAMAATSLTAFLSNPRVRYATPILLVHVLAVFAPVGLELVGVLPRTFSVDGDTFAIHSWSVTISAGWLLAIVMLAALSHLISSTVMVGQLRRAEEQAQLELHLYKWHLEQLLPSTTRADHEPAFGVVGRDQQATWNHEERGAGTVERLAEALYANAADHIDWHAIDRDAADA